MPEVEDVFITLSDEHIELLKPFGEISETPAGKVLLEEGDLKPDLVIVLDGEVEFFRIDRETGQEVSLFTATPGIFIGELNVLTGQARFVHGLQLAASCR